MCLLISSYLGASSSSSSSSSSSFFLPKYSIDKIFLHSCDETIDTKEIKKKKKLLKLIYQFSWKIYVP